MFPCFKGSRECQGVESISEEKYQELKGEVAPWSPPPPSLCSELSIQFEVMVHRDAHGVAVETLLAVSGKEGEEDQTRGSKRQGIESLDENRQQENVEDLSESHPEDPEAWMRKKGGKRRGKVEMIIPDSDEYEGDGDAMFEEDVTEIEEDEEQEEMIIDENQNIKELGCKKCEKTFKKKKELYWHKKNVHAKTNAICDLCNKEFSNKYNLRRHKLSVHDKVKNKICYSCGKHYDRLEDVLSHERKCSGCETCGKICSTLAEMQKHQEECKGSFDIKSRKRKTVFCSICTKQLSCGTKLRKHMKNLHEENHTKKDANNMNKFSKKCTNCERTFKHLRNLKRHVITVHNKKSTETIKCQFCIDSFETQAVLNEHLKIVHQQELRIPCLICTKSYKSRRVLNEHLRKDHSDQSYSCLLCNKVFGRKSNLKSHMKRHSNKPSGKKPIEEVSKTEFYRRRKETEKMIEDLLKQFPEKSRKSIVKNIIKENPSLIDQMDPLSEEDVIDIIKDRSSSDNLVLCILGRLRKKWGRHIITPNIRNCLRNRKVLVKDFFTLVTLDETTEHHFKDKDGNILRRQFTYCNDIEGLLTFKELLEIEKHGTDILEDVDQVIGLDGGVKKLIMCHTWSPKEKGKLRRKLSQKNTIILASVAEVPETDHNLRVIFTLTEVNNLAYLLSADLKVVLMGLGLGSNTSTYSCGIGECKKESKRGKWIKGKNRTISSICENRRKWLTETGGDRKKLNRYKNCEHEPVARPQFDENSPLFPWLPIPKLHAILLGPTNHLVKELVER